MTNYSLCMGMEGLNRSTGGNPSVTIPDCKTGSVTTIVKESSRKRREKRVG